MVVLDLGCNLGENSHLLAQKAKHVVAVDKNEKAIQIAREKFKFDNIEFLSVDAYTYLSQTTGKFDVLILSHILEHIDNPKEFLQKFKAYFKYIYIELPDFHSSYLNIHREKLKMDLIYSDADHIVEYDRWDLKNMLAECGLEIIDAEYIFGVQKYWCRT